MYTLGDTLNENPEPFGRINKGTRVKEVKTERKWDAVPRLPEGRAQHLKGQRVVAEFSFPAITVSQHHNLIFSGRVTVGKFWSRHMFYQTGGYSSSPSRNVHRVLFSNKGKVSMGKGTQNKNKI